jgi:rhodanese-related sulfurtransferase
MTRDCQVDDAGNGVAIGRLRDIEGYRRKSMESKQDVRDPFERISAETAKQMIEKGGVVVVDVREPAEWGRGHLPDARHIPLGTLMNRPRELLQQDGIIFVCAEGVRSAVACEIAAAVGRKQLYNLEGGTIAWRKQGYPLVT